MPDFDKNLQPIIKDKDDSFESIRLQSSKPAPVLSVATTFLAM